MPTEILQKATRQTVVFGLGLGGVAYHGRRKQGKIEPIQVTVCVCGTVMRLFQCQLKQVGLHLHLMANMRHLYREAGV